MFVCQYVPKIVNFVRVLSDSIRVRAMGLRLQ